MKSYCHFALLLLSTQSIAGAEARFDNNKVRPSQEHKDATLEEIRGAHAKLLMPSHYDGGLHDGVEAYQRRMQSVLLDSLAFEQ